MSNKMVSPNKLPQIRCNFKAALATLNEESVYNIPKVSKALQVYKREGK